VRILLVSLSVGSCVNWALRCFSSMVESNKEAEKKRNHGTYGLLGGRYVGSYGS
jgi:hypothetical protein